MSEAALGATAEAKKLVLDPLAAPVLLLVAVVVLLLLAVGWLLC